jgi:adenylosuccinate lyase
VSGEAPIPFGSLLLRDMIGTPEMRPVWTEERTLAAWIQVLRALVEAQRDVGLLDGAPAAGILARLTPEELSVERIRAKQVVHQHLMVSLLKAFRELCGPDAEHFYLGPTTQDVLDTALTLQMVEAHRLVMAQMLALEEALCERALEHRDTVVSGRSHQQPTVPTTFGFVLATWASEVHDHVGRALESEKRWQLGSLGGISGAQNAFVELSDAETARRLQELFCSRLGLGVPEIGLHPRNDRFAEVVNHLVELLSSLGKFGMNLATWQRPEVGEVEVPAAPEAFSSSTSPNKVNPESSEIVEGLAKLARGLGSALLGVQVLDDRDGTRLPVQLVAIPLCYLMASRALATTTQNVRDCRVHAERMRANLEHPALLGQPAAERIMLALYRKTGRRDWAHTALHRCARVSREQQRSFIDVILDDSELRGLFDRSELERLGDPSSYTGTAVEQTTRVVQALRARRGQTR